MSSCCGFHPGLLEDIQPSFTVALNIDQVKLPRTQIPGELELYIDAWGLGGEVKGPPKAG